MNEASLRLGMTSGRCPAEDRAGRPATNRRRMRLPCAMEQQAEDTTIWMVLFLAIAILMVFAALAWMAFGPPIV